MRPYRSVHNNRYRSETRRANPGGCVCVNVTTWERNHVILPVAISPFCLRYVLRETKYGIGVLCENTVNTSVCVSYCPYIERGVQTFSGPKPERERSATALPKQPAQPRLAQLENFKIYFYYNNIISWANCIATALPKQPAQPRLAQLENFKIYFYYNNIVWVEQIVFEVSFLSDLRTCYL